MTDNVLLISICNLSQLKLIDVLSKDSLSFVFICLKSTLLYCIADRRLYAFIKYSEPVAKCFSDYED